jgi:translation initiation factor 2D
MRCRVNNALSLVYTLWKQPNLLPFLTTPAAVVPKLIGGADLMIPGGLFLCA